MYWGTSEGYVTTKKPSDILLVQIRVKGSWGLRAIRFHQMLCMQNVTPELSHNWLETYIFMLICMIQVSYCIGDINLYFQFDWFYANK